MRHAAVGYAIGKLMQVLGAILLVPLALAIWDYRPTPGTTLSSQPEVIGYVFSIALCVAIGTIMVVLLREGRSLQGPREGYAIVTLGWIVLAFWTCLPLWFYLAAAEGPSGGLFRSFTDAFFEIMSGYTTTGATILTDIESVPRSLLFLRSLSHWLGGMGIITLAIVIFPSLGVTAYSMFRGEDPGPSKDRFRPRLAQTASILWGVYGLFTAIEAALLWLCGMNWFEAINHSFATMATGGFSTRNASVAAFDSDLIEWVITVFMYLAGVNFLLHFRALRGSPGTLLRDPEFRFYNAVIAVAIVLTTLVLFFGGLGPHDEVASHYRHEPMTAEQFDSHFERQEEGVSSLYGTFRAAAFQTVSIVTTTGFCTADFDLWPDILTFTLILLMFFGGCAGSTGGGMKMIRIMSVLKGAWNTLRKMTQPRLVAPVRLGKLIVEDDRVMSVLAFFILFTGLFILVAGLMTIFVPDLTTAITCSIATLGNIGPGLGGTGAVENYSWIPIPGKWLLILSMLLGRLEIFTVLIIFRPAVWRR
jgi:trk system potassium uptake protein TrkH